MGELKSSLPTDFLAFGARVSHAFNLFEFTMKLHGGWIVGTPSTPGWYQTDFDDFIADIEIPGYDFAANVKLIDKVKTCGKTADPCLTDRCDTGCYCDGPGAPGDPECRSCLPCSYYYGKNTNVLCYCVGRSTGICTPACLADPTGVGCACDPDYLSANNILPADSDPICLPDIDYPSFW